MEARFINIKSLFVITTLFFTLFLSACNKNEASINLAKLVGFKMVEQNLAIESGKPHHASFTAKHAGTLWTYVKVNNNTPVQVSVIDEETYESFTSQNTDDSRSSIQGTTEEFVEGTVEAGKKYYLIVQSQAHTAPADVSIQSYFLGDK